MKKVFLVAFVSFIALIAQAQMKLTNGVYEVKKVETFDSVSSNVLYLRALVALSDMAGTESKSKLNIDVQDKDAGLVVYKGKVYLGYHNFNGFYGFETYADVTLKIRCKDGKAQYNAIVPSMSFWWTAGNEEWTSAPLNEVYPEYTHKNRLRIKKTAIEFAPTIETKIEELFGILRQKMDNGNDEDF